MRIAWGCLGLALLLAGCAPRQRTPDTAVVSDRPGLHNVVRVHEHAISGSMPLGDAGFGTLREMGVTTIVSVDGARPDVERARAAGLRYAHLPIGYDTVGHDRTADLAALIRREQDDGGLVYVHCHHGKHRGPAAIASALRALGQLSETEALDLLAATGTSPSYPGLFDSVRDADGLSEAEIFASDQHPPEIAVVSGLAAGMAALDRHWDNLKLLAGNGWAVPLTHPDLVPSAEAGIIENHLRTMTEDAESAALGDEFVAWMREATELAAETERALILNERDEATLNFERLRASCKQCHVPYRN
ncbi:MAG: hypothetical protein AAFR38_06010 [Planctomycetota bacterium]